MMKFITSIFIFLFFTAANSTFGQVGGYRNDSTMLQKQQKTGQSADRQSVENKYRNQVDNKNNVNHPVKKISQGARPDMTRARGARPPHVVRQPGSGIPRGLGKPGGAIRRGGR